MKIRRRIYEPEHLGSKIGRIASPPAGHTRQPKQYFDVIPANAGIQVVGKRWIPAQNTAGMTRILVIINYLYIQFPLRLTPIASWRITMTCSGLFQQFLMGESSNGFNYSPV